VVPWLLAGGVVYVGACALERTAFARPMMSALGAFAAWVEIASFGPWLLIPGLVLARARRR